MSTNNYFDNLNVQNVRNAVSPYTNANKVTPVAKVDIPEEKVASSVKDSVDKKPETDRMDFSKDAQVTKKMSDSERAALVKSLKEDLDNQMSRFANMMTQMFQKQGITGLAAGSDEFWRRIASGDFAVDAETQAEAKEAISEDGYWGVKQTSQRIFDFAQALAGDDVDKMKKMQDAIEKGFGEAKKSWGGDMPSITEETHGAITDMFNDYYTKAAGKEEEES